jgi:hypothetical protein
LRDPAAVERIILRLIFRKRDVGDMDWIDLAQDSALLEQLRSG